MSKTAPRIDRGQEPPTPPPTALAILPSSFDEWLTLADYIAKSDLVPKEYQGKAGNCLVAMQMGVSVGLNPFRALQSIAVINGRPCLWGDAVLGIVIGSGLLENIEETDNEDTATCTVKRKGAEKAVTRTFSKAESVNAKVFTNGSMQPLADRPIWKAYPKRMRQMRARAWALRDTFPDVLQGISIREEVEDYSDEPKEARLVGEQTLEDRAAELMPRRRGDLGGNGTASAATVEPPSGSTVTVPREAGTPTEPDKAIMGKCSLCEEPIAAAEWDAHIATAHPELVQTEQPPLPAAPAPPPGQGETTPEACGNYPEFGGCHKPKGHDGPCGPPKEETKAVDTKPPRLTFTIGKQTFETAGITREQMLATFKLAPRVDKKHGEGTAEKVRAEEFKVAHRTELTEEAAGRYILRLNKLLEGN